jgi:hypothetical protein
MRTNDRGINDMSIHRFAMPACAALALALSACSGRSDADKAADASERANAQKEMEVMRNAADGSAAVAVGDMMNDPSIRDQLGMSGGTPTNASSVQADAAAAASAVAAAAKTAATTPATGMEAEMAATGADTGQAQALASCRAMRAVKAGMPRVAGSDEVATAARDLAADPNALSTCQSAM